MTTAHGLDDLPDAPTVPRLNFRFVGTWHPVLLGELDSPELIDRFLLETTGRRDDLVTHRARLRADLREAVAKAREGSATAMFLATQVQPGVEIPITLTVFAPTDLRMSPAIGTDAETVMRVFREALEQRQTDGLDTAREIEHPECAVLRLHRREEQHLDDAISVNRLAADYWMTVPGTKHMLLVSVATPMGEIPNLMLSLFDSIIRAATFEPGP